MNVSCPRCSKENPENGRFCLGCGTDLHGRNNAPSTIGHPPPLGGPPRLQPPPPLGAPRPAAPGPPPLALPGGPPSLWMLAPLTGSTEGDIGRVITIEQVAAEDVVLPRLRTFADGSDGGDLEFSTVFDVSPGMARWHTIRADGEILARLGTRNPFRNFGYVPPEDVRAFARVIADSAFPYFPEPARTRFHGAHPTGPLRLTVRASGVERSVLQHCDRKHDAELDAILSKFEWVLRRAKRDPNAW